MNLLTSDIALSILVMATASAAAAPPNPNCLNATIVPGNTATYNPAILNTAGDTPDICETMESCEAGGVGTSNAVWYSYTPDPGRSGVIVIDTIGSNYDTVLSVFDGCASFNPITFQCTFPSQLACNDNLPLGGLASELTMAVVEGQTYIIKVAQRGASGTGGLLDFNLRWIPPNDHCASATVINTTAFGPPPIPTNNATTEPCEAPESCEVSNVGVSNTVWYEFTAPTDGRITIDTNGSNYDTVLSIFDGCGMFIAVDTPCDLPAELACDDDSGEGIRSMIVDFPVMGCHTYMIKVADYNTSAGGGMLDFNLVFSDSCPEDINKDGGVDVTDLLALLARWGVCQ